MKLVELLARELKDWDSRAKCVAQDTDADCFFWNRLNIRRKPNGNWMHESGCGIVSSSDMDEITQLATDHETAIVTREIWQAERDRIAAPKQSKDGWIRHRGGKCPVEAGAMVDVRRRNGLIESLIDLDAENVDETWLHVGDSCDIMAYRVCEPVDIYACSVDTNAAPVKIEYIDQQADKLDGPLQWRDRITQIDDDIKFEEERHCSNMACMDQERIDLVAKLAAEGFALIAPAVEPVEDMSDWRNWKVGDLLECVDGGSGVSDGQIYQYTGHNDAGEDWVVIWVESNKEGCFATRFKFHSRPTN